ncbi:chromosome segregation protein SMC [Candidatus Uabimicrobium amorphum]|uniref:Chromosome segregation protein SMC n=2 Tax=Uabimicrobium amorphum TaxID=2596890 RepID=A0A5S9IMK6_UABAM|nr:AAA family ATPase [Candidatus Uabimicrobium amorphum]BBM84673.1 chromosome segregation protein SMC [Candidatus Uabimicrobium amorphum]
MIGAPSEIYLFLNQEDRELALQVDNFKYYQVICSLKNNFDNFMTYDMMGAEILIKAIYKFQDLDFEMKMKTGKYGDHIDRLLGDLDSLLQNKRIRPNEDRSALVFLDLQGKKLDVSCLSKGEVKQLAVYIWLKYIVSENSIVLIDELETHLHPDWQSDIPKNLEKWGPSNQYIISTHSYDLCDSLPPSNIKELGVKLRSSKKGD